MNLFHTHVSRSARQYADEVLASGNLSEGRMVKAFEESLARELGLRNPVCVNSGTSALHLALTLAGVGPGDEVILPPQTFVATGMAVLYCGATPVFADVQPDTGNIDVESVRNKRTKKTTAIIGVHWAGLPCDVRQIADVRGPVIIMDAAHALGATYDKFSDGGAAAPVGGSTSNRFTCFSLQASKSLTSSDGGVLCCQYHKDNEDKAKLLRWFGIYRNAPVGDLGERDLQIEETGYKYHMNDLAAAVGLGNLETFKGRLAKRQANGAFYRKELANVPGLKLTRLPADRTHAYYVFPLLVERRDDFVRMMKSKGVPVSVVCSRIDKNPVFGGKRDDLPGMDYFDAYQINIPCHEALSDDDLGVVVDAIKGGW